METLQATQQRIKQPSQPRPPRAPSHPSPPTLKKNHAPLHRKQTRHHQSRHQREAHPRKFPALLPVRPHVRRHPPALRPREPTHLRAAPTSRNLQAPPRGPPFFLPPPLSARRDGRHRRHHLHHGRRSEAPTPLWPLRPGSRHARRQRPGPLHRRAPPRPRLGRALQLQVRIRLSFRLARKHPPLRLRLPKRMATARLQPQRPPRRAQHLPKLCGLPHLCHRRGRRMGQ